MTTMEHAVAALRARAARDADDLTVALCKLATGDTLTTSDARVLHGAGWGDASQPAALAEVEELIRRGGR